jgi:hypothetical protein
MIAIHQLEYSENDIGRHLAQSKKEVTFLFSVDEQKYEVILYWSFFSGRYSVWINGFEEVFDKRSGASIIDCSFQKDGLDMHLLGTRTKPSNSYDDFRCFELLINGNIFSQCPGGHEPPQETILDVLYPEYRQNSNDAAVQRQPSLPCSTNVSAVTTDCIVRPDVWKNL